MKINKRVLAILLERIIFEVKAEDLIERFPELQAAYDAGIRNPQYLTWLSKPQRLAGEPIQDVIGLIKTLDKEKNRMKSKGLSSDIFTYKTAPQLRQAFEDLGTSKTGEIKRLKSEETSHLGTFGEWAVVMPHTRESSCQLGKGTTWCTAATKSQNLFLSYVGRKDQDIILYYIIKKGGDPRSDPSSKLSVGFVNGVPKYGSREDISVDATNRDLNEKKLKSILGSQFEPIMSAMRTKSDAIAGKHPAKSQIEQAAKDPVFLKKALSKLDGDERYDFIKQILRYAPSSKMLMLFTNEKNPAVRHHILFSQNTTPEILSKLSNDDNDSVRVFTASHPNVTPEILAKLSTDKIRATRRNVALNANTHPSTLEKLSTDKEYEVRKYIASNVNTPPSILAKLVGDIDIDVLIDLAKNVNTPGQSLAKLANNTSSAVKMGIAENVSSLPETLAKLAVDEDPSVRIYLARNPNTPPEILSKLANDEEKFIRQAAEHELSRRQQNESNQRKLKMTKRLDEEAKTKISTSLFPAAVEYIEGTRRTISLKGPLQEVQIIRDVLDASRSFYNEVRDPEATIVSVKAKLQEKHIQAKNFEDFMGMTWPL